MSHYLILGITFAFAAAVQPGPLQAYLISQTLAAGWRKTFWAAFSPLLSDGPIIAVTLFILSRMPPVIVQILQLSGGLFLLYLAAAAYVTFKKYNAQTTFQASSPPRTLLKATLVNLFNPNPYLAWSLVMGPLLLKAWRETPWHGMALLIGFYATMVLGLLATIIIFSTTRHLSGKINRILLAGSVLALAGFGLYELFTGLQVWF
jgi:threonine/homoserine/homoserine lactone efflux protein